MGWKCFAGEPIADHKLGHTVMIDLVMMAYRLSLNGHTLMIFIFKALQRQKGMATLTAFLDAAMDVGMLCHPVNLPLQHKNL
jgi:hypothetical protein